MISKIYKYIILYLVFVISIFALYYPIDVFSQNSTELQKKILLNEARTHFHNQINTRKWNAEYGGVYVKPKDGQIPNPYLKNNVLKVDDNLTLIKINPAWMTRQLSEISNIKTFHFRITSLNPINPQNATSPFEKKALEFFENTNNKEFFELGNNSFNYMGALVTTKACLPCHKHQGYKVGDIRGGISINLDNNEYDIAISAIQRNAVIIKIFVLLFLSSITFLIHKQLKNNENLENEVFDRTKEIESTKLLLQKIIDSNLSFVLLSDGTDIIYANKTLLGFYGFKTLDEFKNRYTHISDTFEDEDSESFLTHYIDGEHWIPYLKRNQNSKELKVLIKKDGVKRYFKPYLKDVRVDNKIVSLITFDEITSELIKMEKLEHDASIDPLTKLFNRAKFNKVLSKAMALCDETKSSTTLMFIDIDYFKKVNDTYGHDEGDNVLVKLSEILRSTLRQSDFIVRWGGEEFIVIMQSTDATQAANIAQKLRLQFENYHFKVSKNHTISCGVTEYISGEDKDILLKRVDDALYEAKDNGRNQVVIK